MAELCSFKNIYEDEMANLEESCLTDESENSLEENIRWCNKICQRILNQDRLKDLKNYLEIIENFAILAPRRKKFNQPPPINQDSWNQFKIFRQKAIRIIAFTDFLFKLISRINDQTAAEILKKTAEIKNSPAYKIMALQKNSEEYRLKDELFIKVNNEYGLF